MNRKDQSLPTIILVLLLFATTSWIKISSQETETTSIREKQRKEKAELREKHRKEAEQEKEERRQERTAEGEKRKLEREAKRKEREQERQAKLEERKEARELRKKSRIESKKNRQIARKQIRERNKEIRKARRTKKLVEIISSNDDPLYIYKALVKKGKTEFLKLKNIDLEYNLYLVNQTPKIINEALVIWERAVPFEESSNIVNKKRIAKPIIPYGKRKIKYNELDSLRGGEKYTVKVSQVIFEDGSQWVNPKKSPRD